jgi:cell wall-associated NlpC family hydrolase
MISNHLRFAGLARASLFLAALCVGGCSHTNAVEEQLPYYVTPASAIDPAPDAVMLRQLFDSSTFNVSRTFQPHQITSLEDSIAALVQFALSKVSSDSAKHIHYVWGGKHLDKVTRWSQPPYSNSDCIDRIGLDCSGFVQYLFEQVGFGRGAPELSVKSMATDTNSWKFMRARGYTVNYMPKAKLKDLSPGDVLFFSNDDGGLSHTGIFWDSAAHLNGRKTPAFISSAGSASCDTDYAREALGTPTGVVATPFNNYWQNNLVSAIHFSHSNFMTFTGDSHNFVGSFREFEAPFRYDTTAHILTATAFDDSDGFIANAFLFFRADSVKGAGTYTIPERNSDSADITKFWWVGADHSSPDSLVFFASTPPDTWHGKKPAATGGKVTIQSMVRGPERGSVMGTFQFKANTYYSRFEDSTWMVDTVKHSQRVTKYYYTPTDVSGRFGGIMDYQ